MEVVERGAVNYLEVRNEQWRHCARGDAPSRYGRGRRVWARAFASTIFHRSSLDDSEHAT